MPTWEKMAEDAYRRQMSSGVREVTWDGKNGLVGGYSIAHTATPPGATTFTVHLGDRSTGADSGWNR